MTGIQNNSQEWVICDPATVVGSNGQLVVKPTLAGYWDLVSREPSSVVLSASPRDPKWGEWVSVPVLVGMVCVVPSHLYRLEKPIFLGKTWKAMLSDLHGTERTLVSANGIFACTKRSELAVRLGRNERGIITRMEVEI